MTRRRGQHGPGGRAAGGAKRPILALALVVMGATVFPVVPHLTRGLALVASGINTILQLEEVVIGITLFLVILRIVTSVWIYFALSDSWGHELAWMGLFLISPLIGFILWIALIEKRTPPPGYEEARFEDGIVVIPVYEQLEMEGLPPQPVVGVPPWLYGPPPPRAPAEPVRVYSPQPSIPGPVAPPEAHPFEVQGYVPSAVPVPPVPRRKVGERRIQKRDYLEWTNVLLLVFDAIILASMVATIVLTPFLLMDGGINAASQFDALFTPAGILFQVLIQDSILVWMIWHQIIRRKVIPLSEMGISGRQLAGDENRGRWVALGIVYGLVLFSIAFAIEVGQASVGFEPDPEQVISPDEGDLGGYLLLLISTCIIAPIAEELYFRGYAFYAFNKRFGLTVAILVSAIGFSLIHLNPYGLLPIFVAGIGLAIAYQHTGSLVTPMIAHAVNNFIAVTLPFLGYI